MTTHTAPAAVPRERHLPGESGIWLFVLGDMVMFSALFTIFLYYRAENVPLFASSQAQLSQTLGMVNTFLMLTSSWFVAMAVQAARRNLGRVTPILLWLAFACGVGFGVVKFFEWNAKISAGITLTTNDFFMYYFIFTGIHFVHVLLGMLVLGVLARYTRDGVFDATKIRNLESGASFWHLVDLLWIILFALLYLVK